jgi:hypothetical protein
MSFNEIQEKINKTFEGANAAYLNTAAGKIEAISIATGNFAEVVGGSLVDALIRSSGSNGVDGLVLKIDRLAQATADSITEFEEFAFITAYIFDPKKFDLFKGGERFARDLNAFRASQQLAGVGAFDPMNNAVSGYAASKKAAADAKKAADQQAKLLKQSIDNQKKLTAERKKQEALKKAGSIFDLDQVQLIAALKGKLSDEDRKKVELQFALLTGNTKQATALTLEIAKAQGLGKDLAEYLANLPDAKNPFASWDAYLDALIIKAQKAANVGASVSAAAAVAVSSMNTSSAGSSFYVGGTKVDIPATNVATMPKANTSASGGGLQATTYVGGTPIYVQIDGKTIASALQDSSLSGIGSSVNRTGR